MILIFWILLNTSVLVLFSEFQQFVNKVCKCTYVFSFNHL